MSKIETLPIDSIKIGDRRREDYGNIFELANSIKKYGLLHPIVVDQDNNLVAGHRRLQACTIAGMRSVPIRRLENLTEAQLREIELEENLKRKDLTDYERTKNMLALAETVAEILRAESDFPTESVEKPKLGRPPKRDAEEKVAARLGVPPQTFRDLKQHSAAVEEFPVLKTLPKYNAIETAKNLRQLPPERQQVVLQKMEAEQESYLEDVAAINRQHDVSKRIRDALYKISGLALDEETLDLWMTDQDRDEMDDNLRFIAQARENLDQLEKALTNRRHGFQVIRGGQAREVSH